MTRGIEIKGNDLYFNGEELAKGGDYTNGLSSRGLDLLFGGNIISTCNDLQRGIHTSENRLYWGDVEVKSGGGEVVDTYWNPPAQDASVYKPWDYAGLISEYDKLMAEAPDYMTKYRYEKNGVPVVTENGNYELYHYELVPSNYTKTIMIQAGLHGNEMDAKQQLLRIVEILVKKTDQYGYTVFKEFRENVRLIIIPCVSPYGHEMSSMNIPYKDVSGGINPSRNYDFNHQYADEAVGCGGDYPFEIAETQHVRDVFNEIGAENIDYFMDWHDGGDVLQHFWINYQADSSAKYYIMDLINHLVDKYKIENPIITSCKDTSKHGAAYCWAGKSNGVMASTCEYIGGYLGYDFGSEHMTISMDIRGNFLLQTYKHPNKGWTVGEQEGSVYFHFDFAKSFTRQSLRSDGAELRTRVTDVQIYERWDNLQLKFPQLITKSEKLGTNAEQTQDIYTYTFGSGNNKVLYAGGIMRYGAAHKIDEFAIYQIIEYLCNDYIVNQSKFLQDLRDNYTIIVLPCIDNTAGNAVVIRDCGLNNMALTYKKWQIIDGKCQPTEYALSNHDIPIIKKVIDENTDLKCIVSGGEILSGYAGNSQDYTTDFETHIVVPKNQTYEPTEYADHLTNDRNENVVIEHTTGTTFGDYAYDNYMIPTFYVQLQVSKRWGELAEYHTLSSDSYLYYNYEAGRRMSNIVNLFIGKVS